MRKKIFCLLLSALMLLPLLAGCADNDESSMMNDPATTSKPAVTLRLFMITEKETKAEAVSAVEVAINKLLDPTLKVKLELVYLTADKYYAELERNFKATEDRIAFEEAEAKRLREEAKEARKRGETVAATTAADTAETLEETIKNEYGMDQVKYPAATENQVDIFLINGYDKYTEYIGKSYLARLDEELNAASKKLKNYIYPAFMTAAKINGSTFAIPNNHIIGEYTYLLIDRELLKKYSYDPDTINSLTDCESFLDDVKKHESGVAPLRAPVEPLNMVYWPSGSNWSLLASSLTKTATLGSMTTIRNIFSIGQYTNQLLFNKKMELGGYYATNPQTNDFAVGVVKGNADLVETYGDKYIMKVLEYPRADESILYQALLGVSSYSKYPARCMEVITYLNTRPELRNLLQYGIEGVNYEINDDGYLVRLNKDYMMNIVNTGNIYMAYPEEGQSLNVWEYGKAQNLDSLISPYLGFTFEGSSLDKDLMKRIETLSAEYLAGLKACKTVEEIEEYVKVSSEVLTENADMKAALDLQGTTSPYGIYFSWFNTNWPST